MVEGCIWKTNPTTYNLQLVFKNNTEFKTLDSYLKDWRLTGTGTNKNGYILNIFSKEFQDPKNWISFAKSLPFEIYECDRDGNKKRVKTAVAVKRTRKTSKTVVKSAKQSGRCCGKCGMSGHNSRTCKVKK
jgi:hypothetical protein